MQKEKSRFDTHTTFRLIAFYSHSSLYACVKRQTLFTYEFVRLIQYHHIMLKKSRSYVYDCFKVWENIGVDVIHTSQIHKTEKKKNEVYHSEEGFSSLDPPEVSSKLLWYISGGFWMANITSRLGEVQKKEICSRQMRINVCIDVWVGDDTRKLIRLNVGRVVKEAVISASLLLSSKGNSSCWVIFFCCLIMAGWIY